MANRYAVGSGLWSDTSSVWSTTDGGSPGNYVPADGDDVFICAGVTVTMDVDQGSFTGLQNVVIRGGAVPGMLEFHNGTSGHLKIRTGYNLSGTLSGGNKGRLLANATGIWSGTDPLAFQYKAVIELIGTAQMQGDNLECRLYCTQPVKKYIRAYNQRFTVSSINMETGTITLSSAHGWAENTPVAFYAPNGTLPEPFDDLVVYYVKSPDGSSLKLQYLPNGTEVDITSVGSGTIYVYDAIPNIASSMSHINVFDDVTDDEAWTTASGHNYITYVHGRHASNMNPIRMTLPVEDIQSSYISIGNGSSQEAGPILLILFVSRNVSIRIQSASSSTQGIVNISNSVFQCEVRGTGGTAASPYGMAFYNLASTCDNVFSGVIVNFSRGVYNSVTAFRNLYSGIICGINYNMIFNTADSQISGFFAGNGSGVIDNSFNSIVDGIIFGVDRPVGSCSNMIFDSTCKVRCAAGSYGVLHFCRSSRVLCDIKGCVEVINGGNDNVISGDIIGCHRIYKGTFSGANPSGHICTGRIIGCRYIHEGNTGEITLRNTVVSPLSSLYDMPYLNNNGSVGRIYCENLNRVNGDHRILDFFGNIVKTACDGTDGAPSQDPDGGNGDCLEVRDVQSNCNRLNPLRVLSNYRVWVPSGTQTFTIKLQSTINIPQAGLLWSVMYIGENNAIEYADISDIGISQRVNNSDWSQQLSVTFGQYVDGWVSIDLAITFYDPDLKLYVWPIPEVYEEGT